MKKIGLIGGLSWLSTAEYYRRINELVQEKAGGVSSADLFLASLNREEYVQAVINREDEQAGCQMILGAAESLERAGADFIVISCNDVHRFVPFIKPAISIPFVHIAEATAARIKETGIRSVALMGVRKTMEGDFYPEILQRHGINAIIPNEKERSFIHDKIYEELTKGILLDKTREEYVELIEQLSVRGAEGVILGCTELPLLITQGDTTVSTFSTTEIHCETAVSMAVA